MAAVFFMGEELARRCSPVLIAGRVFPDFTVPDRRVVAREHVFGRHDAA
jgi:hypothetical protein